MSTEIAVAPGCRVLQRLERGIDRIADHAERGRHALHLRDDREAALLAAESKRRGEGVARKMRGEASLADRVRDRMTCRVLHEPALPDAAARNDDVGSPLGHDAFEEVAHALAASAPSRWLVATRRSRRSRATPESIAFAAAPTPSRMLAASPAT